MTGPRKTAFVLLLAAVVVAAAVHAQRPDAAPSEKLIDLPLAAGDHQRVLFAAPPKPKAAIVMLPGGSGEIGLTRGGDIRHNDNFVVRTRGLWNARGYAVLIPDTIDRANLRGLRSSPEYARVVIGMIGFAHDQVAAPVFLLGTSQGSIAAMNGAAHAPPETLAGVVLTESVSVLGGSGETVFDANPQDVRVRALVLANQDDRCDVAPPAMAAKIVAAMTHSPDVKLELVSGGVSRSSRDCGSLTPHGYYGIEDRVVRIIDSWMESQLHRN
jgi:pimeloyl-ACP methyl ester carboxylesterase